MSKVALNAYTQVMARRCPEMRINCLHLGFVKTDINWNIGVETTKEGARGPIMLVLLPASGPSVHYFDKTTMVEF
ncbi:hypothetical protein IEQ34_013861 [Dendrobium chrysotoxum]|uniref:Uncharacterized protein n=1 Tax=Dendrobium chrysotoxum TaxID=161865 RepID=A0AAV7GPN0_DENCH|nr:hypothetical protein IEQ34_013861 [Dendrobium chrysotoxum]